MKSMIRIAAATVIGMALLSMFSLGQTPAPPAQNPIRPVTVPPANQNQVDMAWKDLEIAQLHLQLAVSQALEQTEKGAWYDFQKRQFLVTDKPAEKKETEPAKK